MSMICNKDTSWRLTSTILLILISSLISLSVSPAAAATGQLTATWTDSTPTDHDGFKIQRKTGSTGTYAQIATVGPTVMSYLDTGLTAGSTYCYQVAAYNAAGDSLPTSEVCAAVPTPVVYPLTLTKTGTGTGTVTSSPAGINNCGATCSANFTGGTTVALTAAPAAGSTFTGWSGACTGTGACTVILSAATTVTATFTSAPLSFALTVSKSGTGSGTVTSSNPAGINCGATCSANFNSGTVVTLTGTPATSSTFTGWSGACTGTGTCKVTLTAATSVTASFTAGTAPPPPASTTYPLTVSPSGSGSGTVTSNPAGISCGSTCSASFTGGATVTLTASAATGSTFTGWSGGGCSGTGTCGVTLGAATTVTATFAPTPPASGGLVAAYAFNEGSGTTTVDVTGNGQTGTLAGATWVSSGKYGSALAFNGTSSWVTVADTALLDLTTGLTVSAWVNPTLGTDWRTVVLKETASDHAYALYASDGAGLPAGHVNLGNQDLQVTGATSLPLNTWSHLAMTYDGAILRLFVNGVQVGSQAVAGAVVTSTNPLRIGGNSVWGEYFAGQLDDIRLYNRALSVSELQTDMQTPVAASPSAPSSVALTVAKSGTGTGTVGSTPAGITCGDTCSASYSSGTSVTLSPTPATGSTFTSWSGACAGTGTCKVTLTAATNVTATFNTVPPPSTSYTLSVSESGSGIVKSSPAGIDCGVSCSAAFASNTVVKLTATPATGFTFTGWGGDCAGTGPCTLTMTQAKNATATFTAAPPASAPTAYTLTVKKSGTGGGTVGSTPAGITCGSSCSASFASGKTVTLSAYSAMGSIFTGWSGACTGTGSCSVSMNQAQSVTATFKRWRH